jgi:hypothetical protein
MAILDQTMSDAKKILITTRRREVILVRNIRETRWRNCPVCEVEREMMSLDEAVAMIGIGGRTIVGHIEAGSLHSSETEDGRLLICRLSLDILYMGERK